MNSLEINNRPRPDDNPFRRRTKDEVDEYIKAAIRRGAIRMVCHIHPHRAVGLCYYCNQAAPIQQKMMRWARSSPGTEMEP